MNLLLNKKPRVFIRNLVILLVLFNFTFFSLAPKTFAQNQSNTFQSTETNSFTPNSVDQSSVYSDQQSVTTSEGSETGRVLQFGLGDLLDAVFGGLKRFFGWIGDQIWGFLMKIIAGIGHIIDSALGSDTSKACVASNDERCTAAIAELAKIDPFFDPNNTLPSKLNLFTLVDDSYETLYANIPDANFLEESTYLVKETIFGTKVAFAASDDSKTEGEKDLGDLIKGLWKKMRDLSYIASVLILITIGFMVMMRRRLDPKTVVTATSSVPRIAIGLLLITFSFALSSLFVDAIHLLVELTRNYFGDLPGLAGPMKSAAEKFGGEFLWLPFFTLASESVIGWATFVRLLYPVLIGSAAVAGPAALIFWIPIIAALAFDIIIRIGMFILALMLFWSLLVRYATLVILTVFSPFFFLIGMVPGFEGITLTWFKRMLAVVISFPAILVIAYLALSLLSPNSGSGIGAPPPLGTSSGILNISALVGLGVLYFAHKVPATIDDVLGIKDTKAKGPTPLLLATGAMGGLQSYSSINKGVSPLANRINDLAGRGTAEGKPTFGARLAGGAMTFLRPFAPGNFDSVKHIKEARIQRGIADTLQKEETTATSSHTQRGGSSGVQARYPGSDEDIQTRNQGTPTSPSIPGSIEQVDFQNPRPNQPQQDQASRPKPRTPRVVKDPNENPNLPNK